MSRKHRRRKTADAITVRRRTEPGAPPGVVVADPAQPKPAISVIAYDATGLIDTQVAGPDEAHALVGKHSVTWINVEGLGDAKVIERFGELFGLHRLALEDTVNVHQRAKIETYGEVLFIVLRTGQLTGKEIEYGETHLIVGKGFVVSIRHGAS